MRAMWPVNVIRRARVIAAAAAVVPVVAASVPDPTQARKPRLPATNGRVIESQITDIRISRI